jgi:uncharacterized membrane protein YdjX (TVP38/TMEM64 family)
VLNNSPIVRLVAKSISSKRGIRKYIGPKRTILFIMLIYFIFLIWNLHQNHGLSPEIIFNQKQVHPVGAIFLFVGLYIISIIFLLPSLPLNLAGGFFWGGIYGGLLSAIGVTIGSWISFCLSRVMFGEILAESFENKWFKIVQEEFDKHNWKFVAFARLNPIIPTGPLNYILGLTSMANIDYVIVTFFSLLAPSVAIAYIGSVIQGFALSGTSEEELIRNIILSSGFITIIATLRFANKIFRKGKDLK